MAHKYEHVSSGNGYWVVNNEVRTQVIDQEGNIVAPLELAGGEDINDANGNELVSFTATASAVNNVGIKNSATGANPIIYADGEADTGLTFTNSELEEILILDGVATAVNELTVTNAATGNSPTISATGGDTDINVTITAKGAGDIVAGGASGIVSSVSGLTVPFMPMLAQQALSGAGAVNLTTYYTAVTNTGADALTLADSTVKGQLKKVKMIVDPGTDSTLTFNTNATIVFADVGDYAVLMWNGTDWIPIELGNDADGATAPVYTPAA